MTDTRSSVKILEPSNENSLVQFTWFPNNNNVQIALSSNDWKPVPMQREDGQWVYRTSLVPGFHYYKYVADGQWLHSDYDIPKCIDKEGTYNNYIQIFTQGMVEKKFVYSGNQSQVSISGSFDGWVGRFPMDFENGEWVKKIWLESGICQFKFILWNRDWVCDENQEVNHDGNNQIFVELVPQANHYDDNEPKHIDKPVDILDLFTDQEIRKKHNHVLRLDSEQEYVPQHQTETSERFLPEILVNFSYTKSISQSLAQEAIKFLSSSVTGKTTLIESPGGVEVLISSLITERVELYFPEIDPHKILPVGIQRISPGGGQKPLPVVDPWGNLVILTVSGDKDFAFLKGGEEHFLEHLKKLQKY